MRKRAQTGQQAGMPASGAWKPVTVGAGSDATNDGRSFEQQTAYKVSMPSEASRGVSGSMIGSGIVATNPGVSVPADFDRAGFESNAQAHFIRLQAAYDAGKLDDIREFTTQEMFAELETDFAAREPGVQRGEVLRLEAKVVEVVDEENRYVVSVQFTGFIRYGEGTADEPFDEVWHLSKPRQGSGGWVVAGIQQVA